MFKIANFVKFALAAGISYLLLNFEVVPFSTIEGNFFPSHLQTPSQQAPVLPKDSSSSHAKETNKEESPSKTLYQKAQKLYRHGRFTKVLQLYQKAKKQGSSLSPDWKKLQSKAELILLLTEETEKKVSFQNPVDWVIMVDGQEYYGTIVSRNPNSLLFQFKYGRMELPKSRIAQVKSLTAQEYRQKIRKQQQQKILQTQITDERKILQLFQAHAEYGMPSLNALLVDYLEKQDSQAVAKIKDFQAKHLYQCYLWFRTMKKRQRAQRCWQKLLTHFSQTPSFQQMQGATTSSKKQAPSPEEKISKEAESLQEENSTQQHTTSLDKLKHQAEKHYKAGYHHLRRSFPSMPKADQELAKAKHHLKLACQYYREALQLAPKNQVLSRKLQKATEFYHHCIKQTRLSEQD